jgi:hypothetical protein
MISSTYPQLLAPSGMLVIFDVDKPRVLSVLRLADLE